ncbi:MAG: lipoprotein-releasing ABC transporter ATP-binding protein LolD [Gammaproteobacteria bacterium]|nr:MAG: lipoprotein-releasing ABC transporter ATP-binding protein LolD [Gammaproteobacteria bacterium]RLA53659.1 MAG: lipoprotein-releasing ABC transporter ATP-binding protein LolD [Gammaproteobacteria bacterium]
MANATDSHRAVESSAQQSSVVMKCQDLCKSYSEAGSQLDVLKGINLTVRRGEKIAIVGVSGSGKSTLLNMLGGLDIATTGQVIVRDRSFGDMSESEIARWRNIHLGFVYQFHHLLGEFSALENVAMPLLIGGAKKREAYDRSKQILTDVGLLERLDHKPSALSGGERQRVAIARALVTQPSCVLMDEPTGNLDPDTAEKVLALLLRLNVDLGISIIVVTHDQDIARKMDRVLVLEHGVLSDVSA